VPFVDEGIACSSQTLARNTRAELNASRADTQQQFTRSKLVHLGPKAADLACIWSKYGRKILHDIQLDKQVHTNNTHIVQHLT
jgi:hypothetical protein